MQIGPSGRAAASLRSVWAPTTRVPGSCHDRHHRCRARRTDAAAGTPPGHRDARAALAGAGRAPHGRGVARASARPCRCYVGGAGGGVLVDVDGNSLIDLGSGIAVTTVGNARPAVVAARAASRSPRSPTPASWSRPTRATSPSAEALNRLTPGDHEKRSALFNSGAEAVENAVKIARRAHRPAGRRRLRPRLPRPHQPDDGADRQEHAVQARLRPVRAGDLPRADVLPVPRRAARPAPTAARARHRASSRSRSAPTTSPRSSSSRSRARAASSCPPTGFLPALAEWCRAQRRRVHRRRGADRLRPHRRDVRLRARGRRPRPDRHRQGHRRRPAARRRSPAAPRSWTPPHVGGLGGTYGGNPVACAAALGRHRDDRGRRTWSRARPHIERR